MAWDFETDAEYQVLLDWTADFVEKKVAPLDMVLVCSSTGAIKVLVKSADGTQDAQTGHTLDCPLCAGLAAPPPVHTLALPSVQPLGHVLQSIPAARIAALTAAPLPPRGPPALS